MDSLWDILRSSKDLENVDVRFEVPGEDRSQFAVEFLSCLVHCRSVQDATLYLKASDTENPSFFTQDAKNNNIRAAVQPFRMRKPRVKINVHVFMGNKSYFESLYMS